MGIASHRQGKIVELTRAGRALYSIRPKSICRGPVRASVGLDLVPLSKTSTHLLASSDIMEKNRNSLACLRNAGSYFAESYCIPLYCAVPVLGGTPVAHKEQPDSVAPLPRNHQLSAVYQTRIMGDHNLIEIAS